MNNEKENEREKQLKKAVPNAFKRLLKEIENEPDIVIEAGEAGSGIGHQSLEDVQRWLFKSRKEYGRANNRTDNPATIT